MPRATRTTTSKDGTTIAYEMHGQGPPLIIVSGALGSRAMPFAKPMRDELAKDLTIYDYDRRGRGESGDTKPYALAREIEDLRAMCEVAGGSPYVVALSSGAALALEAAAAGVPMKALAAYEPPYVDTIDRDYGRKVSDLIAQDKRAEAVTYFMTVVGVPRIMTYVMRLMPFWKIALANAHTLPYDATVMNGFEVPAKRFADIRVPTTVMWGGKTTPGLRSAAKKVAATIPGATDRMLPKQSHAVKPSALRAALVEAFLGTR